MGSVKKKVISFSPGWAFSSAPYLLTTDSLLPHGENIIIENKKQGILCAGMGAWGDLVCACDGWSGWQRKSGLHVGQGILEDNFKVKQAVGKFV